MVVAVDEVVALERPYVGWKASGAVGIGGSSSSVDGKGGWCFFWPPKENVRPAALRKPFEDDFGTGGRGASLPIFLCEPRQSSIPASAVEGAVETLLWRDEVSVEMVLVVFDEPPLPLPLQKEKKEESAQWNTTRQKSVR